MTKEILEILENVMYWETCPDDYKEKIKAYLNTKPSAGENDVLHIVSRCASQVPTNWCDSLLTGKDAALTGEAGKWGCPDIENLLRAIKKRIEHCG